MNSSREGHESRFLAHELCLTAHELPEGMKKDPVQSTIHDAEGVH